MSKVKKVGMIVDLSSEFIRSFLRGLSDELSVNVRAHDLLDLRFLPAEDIRKGHQAVKACDAFIAQVQDDEFAGSLRASGKPVVDVLYKRRHPDFAVANPDSRAIGAEAARYFLSRGFRHFAYCGRPGVLFSDEREVGFRAVVEKAGNRCMDYTVSGLQFVSFQSRFVSRDEDLEGPADWTRLRTWARKLPERTAVLCCHDHRAYQLLRVCAEINRPVPADIAILGVDNDPVLCGFTEPRLSSVDSNAFAVGQSAVKAILSMFRTTRRTSPPCLFVPPREIVTRESTDVFGFTPDWLSEAVVFLREHISDNITAADVVATTGFSHTKVERTFVARLGMSIQQAIISARLERASHLLTSTDLPLKAVARESGFGSLTYFCSSFVRARGLTPLAWRNHKQ